MNNIAIIPARNGSKSIPNKNLQIVGKYTLVGRALKSAIRSGMFSKIILTTDIPCLIDEFQDSKEVLLHRRPDALATDDALMSDVVQDVIDSHSIEDKDYLWLLHPTSPFRLREDYLKIAQILGATYYKCLISVTSVGAAHPHRMYTIKGTIIHPLKKTCFDNKQNLIPTYIRNGCYYVVQAKKFREKPTFYHKPCGYFLMPEERSINIDSPLDLKFAREMLRDHEKDSPVYI